MLGTGRSVLDSTVPVAGKRGCIRSSCTLFPAGSMVNLAESWGCSEGQEPFLKASKHKEGGSPRAAGWGRLGCPTAGRDQSGLGSSSPGQHSNLHRQDMFLEAWAGCSARTTSGPVQAGEDGEVKPFPCWAQGKAVLLSSKVASETRRSQGEL